MDTRKTGDQEFLTLAELALRLNMKPKTLYVRVSEGDLPYYRIGRLIRFRRDEIDLWLESQRAAGVKETVRIRTRKTKLSDSRIDRMVRKAIDQERGEGYTPPYGKPDQIKGSRR
jgi:excisionase family DNA binding protein